MRKSSAQLRGLDGRIVMTVAELESFHTSWRPGIRYLVRVASAENVMAVHSLAMSGLGDLMMLTTSRELYDNNCMINVLDVACDLQNDDVVALAPERSEAQVLFRSSDSHHAVFLTNRCNSYCVMCSQPPTRKDDSWLVDEAKEISRHIVGEPRAIGFTGGEPLLLGRRLREILESFATDHPTSVFDVLTNGRLFSDPALAEDVLQGLKAPVSWLVPLYGHCDFLHDFVVQSPSAFEETVEGLLTLQAHRQPIQLRVVLIEPVLNNLHALCDFIARNLPFVREVALMGCEPIGFALANRQLCEVDIRDWHDELRRAVTALMRAQVPAIFMNLPLCALPEDLRSYATRSISDWKRVFATECNTCEARNKCSGLFAWHERGWKPTTIHRLKEAA